MDANIPEAELIAQYMNTHSPAIREEMILRFIPLVHFVLGRLGISQWSGSEYDDLVSQGMLGLIEAVDHFNPNYGTRLSTYATFKIRGKVLDYLRELDWLPRAARQRVRLVQGAIQELESTLHRLPTDEELAGHLDMEPDVLQQAMMDSSRVIISLDDDMDDSVDGSSSLHDRISDDKQSDPLQILEDKGLNHGLIQTIKAMPERDQQVLSLYYFEEMTFKEIGRILGVSESRICQLHGRAMITLKAMMTVSEVGGPLEDKPEKLNNPVKLKDSHTPINQYRFMERQND